MIDVNTRVAIATILVCMPEDQRKAAIELLREAGAIRQRTGDSSLAEFAEHFAALVAALSDTARTNSA